MVKFEYFFLVFQSVAVDESGMYFAIVGRMGVAHYSLLSRRWKLFGNESQVKICLISETRSTESIESTPTTHSQLRDDVILFCIFKLSHAMDFGQVFFDN
jgi:hypothetical protein